MNFRTYQFLLYILIIVLLGTSGSIKKEKNTKQDTTSQQEQIIQPENTNPDKTIKKTRVSCANHICPK